MTDYISNFNRETRDILNYLSTKAEICDIYVKEIPPASMEDLESWEYKNSCYLPNDLKIFYLERDGIFIEWKMKTDNENSMQLGRILYYGINELTRIGLNGNKDLNNPSLLDLEDLQYQCDDYSSIPHFDESSRNFEIDNCNGFGKVCLVYRNTVSGMAAENPEYWYLDRALQWHFITNSFTNYYRLLISHLGLPQWYSLFTREGLPPYLYQWYYMLAPGRIFIHNENWKSLIDTKQTKSAFDVEKVFKEKDGQKKAASSSKSSIGLQSSSTSSLAKRKNNRLT